MSILYQGMKGSAVESLQTKLKELGFDPGYIDGMFGPATTQAVKAFQTERKLPADGIAGPQTLSALGLTSTER